MAIVVQFLIGLLFGAGLVIAGMANPAKVLNFLDVAAISTGGWDASLAFVMGGAILVALPGYWLVRRLDKPLLAPAFHLPQATAVDRRIVLGPAVFGVGWGLAGFCPGPSMTALSTGTSAVFLFVGAMLFGMWAANRVSTLSSAGK